MFTIIDWRAADTRVVADALEAEGDRWRSEFAWDVRDAWRSIQPARIAGTLPGLLAIDYSGRVVGWTCFLLHRGALQVAVLTSHAPDVTAALVDAIVASPEAQRADVHAICVRDAAPSLRDVLAQHGFESVTYRYLTMSTKPGFFERSTKPGFFPPIRTPDPGPAFRAWRPSDSTRLADLCSRAYASPSEIRAFAPLGTDAEWQDYVASLVSGPGCGCIVPSASVVLERSAGGRLDGAVIATDLGMGTGHIAQVAVDPDMQGRGVGARLVTKATAAFAVRGFSRVTLLVSEENHRAAGLYAGLGFRNRASFVVALNRQPRRVTSVARAIGGANWQDAVALRLHGV